MSFAEAKDISRRSRNMSSTLYTESKDMSFAEAKDISRRSRNMSPSLNFK